MTLHAWPSSLSPAICTHRSAVSVLPFWNFLEKDPLLPHSPVLFLFHKYLILLPAVFLTCYLSTEHLQLFLFLQKDHNRIKSPPSINLPTLLSFPRLHSLQAHLPWNSMLGSYWHPLFPGHTQMCLSIRWRLFYTSHTLPYSDHTNTKKPKSLQDDSTSGTTKPSK